MVWGKGDDQQFAMFELTPSFSRRGAVEVKWFQAYPLRQGVGSRAMQELQAMAREDDIALTLFPWDKGQVSQAKLTKFYRGQGFKPAVKGSKNMQWDPSINEGLRVDVPNEEWLQDAIDYAVSKSPDRHGLPYMGKTTATVKDVSIPVSILARIPGMRSEQSNVRHRDLAAIMKIMQDTGKLPLHAHSGEEYKPFINVAYDGSAWVNEGNHRIMAAAQLGWESLPVEISYFDGGERIKSGPMYPGKIGLGEPLEEFSDVDLEEDWRNWVAAGALGLGAMGGAQAATQHAAPVSKPAIVQPAQAQKAAPAATQAAPAQKAAAQQTQQAAPAQALDATEKYLASVASQAGIKGTELAQFLAQVKHESWDFTKMDEKGSAKYFKHKYDPQFAPKTAKIIGNTKVGDGERYHGRGYIQLTGRDNYRMAGEALGIDLLNKPQLAADPATAAKIAVWFWQARTKNIADFSDTKSVTHKINPALRGLADRQENFAEYAKIFRVA